MNVSMICLIAQFFSMQLQAPVTVQASPKQVVDMANYSISECKKEEAKKKKDQNELSLKTQKENEDEKAALRKK